MDEISPGTLYPGATVATPSTATVLITTGNLPAGYYTFVGIFTATVAAAFNYEILDASDVVVQTSIVRVIASTTTVYPLGPIPIGTNYEVRVRPQANITGGGNSAAVSIIASLQGVA